MTGLLIGAALALIALAALAIGWPLFREETVEAEPVPPEAEAIDPMAELTGRRDSIYQAIRELRFDHEVGKVSEADYQAFDSQLKAQAVVVLKEIDALAAAEADPDLDARVEAEIAALRRNGTAPAEKATATPVTSGGFCPQCGSKVQRGDSYCGTCGAGLT